MQAENRLMSKLAREAECLGQGHDRRRGHDRRWDSVSRAVRGWGRT